MNSPANPTSPAPVNVGSFSCRTPLEARDLAQKLSAGTPRPFNVETGLFELLMNAIEHGNLGLDHDTKARLLDNDTLEDEILHRLDIPPYNGRKVTIEVSIDADTLTYLITDDGDGFDWTLYENLSGKLNKQFGRGIMIARKIGFDGLEYMGRGNIVRATVRL